MHYVFNSFTNKKRHAMATWGQYEKMDPLRNNDDNVLRWIDGESIGGQQGLLEAALQRERSVSMLFRYMFEKNEP